MTYFFSLVAILIFIMYSFLYIIDRLCVSMWVFHFWSPECEYSFQLGLHLLKVTCVICCFFWKIKSFHFTTFVFLSLSLGWRSRYVCGRSGSCGGGGGTSAKPHPHPNPPFRIGAVRGTCFEMVFWVTWFKNVCSSPEFMTKHLKQSSAEMLWCPYSVCRWLMLASTRVLCVIHVVWDKWCSFRMCLLLERNLSCRSSPWDGSSRQNVRWKPCHWMWSLFDI